MTKSLLINNPHDITQLPGKGHLTLNIVSWGKEFVVNDSNMCVSMYDYANHVCIHIHRRLPYIMISDGDIYISIYVGHLVI